MGFVNLSVFALMSWGWGSRAEVHEIEDRVFNYC